LIVEGHGPASSVGSQCLIYPKRSDQPIPAEVVGFRDSRILLMPLGEIRGIGPGSEIVSLEGRAVFSLDESILGRIVDGRGDPLDGGPPVAGRYEYPIYGRTINPLKRARIEQPLALGIRAIDGLLTCARGQRLGIFSGSGVGKSVLLGMIARNTEADVNVIALIGERGREVREFIERDLGEEGLRRSVVVAATSDQPPLIRMRGAFIATTIAEFFRDLGKHVILMVDSITRFSMSQREVGLAVGEPPTTKGYTPTVFNTLPKLMERAGYSDTGGSITGLYAVLVEGDDLNDPIADAARSILDGHIVLSRDLAAQGHYPAIDVLQSVSRLMKETVSEEHRRLASQLIATLAVYRRSEDLINIGAYVAGSNPKIDYAIKMVDPINRFLQQRVDDRVDFEQTLEELRALLKKG
ncbi:MAG: FliI/YscN family ATPase, partial [Deltaproteobacteria bacterium]|nr:FliI/YscN family ATPase [Deltaproteobacteria bacterium]